MKRRKEMFKAEKPEKYGGSRRTFFATVLSVVLAAAYFFLVTSLFRGWQNAKLFDAVPDLAIFVIGFSLLAYSFSLRNRAERRYLASGAALICLQRLLEIPLQEYQAIVGTLGPAYWAPPMIIGFAGLVLVMRAFEENAK